MLKETKILFDNIKDFRNRNMINEGISEGDIRKYMENHQFVYIFYAGDGKNPRGWRTIRPYVLGVIKGKKGNIGVRAWQDKGRSSDYMNRPTRPKRNPDMIDSFEHDFWYDDLDGKQKPGWRMFRLDRIEQIYPTGQRFVDGDGNVIFPPKYNKSGDNDMSSIIFQVTDRKEPDTERDYRPSDLKITQKREKKDWSVFQRGNANRKQITPEEISYFQKIARDISKKGISAFFIAINDRDEFELIDEKNRNKVPQQAIVGNLSRLYDKEVRKQPDVAADKYHDDKRKEALNEVKDKKIGGFPHNIKSFFKT